MVCSKIYLVILSALRSAFLISISSAKYVMLCPQKVVLTGIEDKRIILINLYVYSVTRDSWCGDWPVKDLLPSAPVQLLHYTTQKQTNDNQKFAKFVFRQM